MESKCFLAVAVFTILMAFVEGQVECPRCTNKYDHASCTATQECGVDWNYCELRVHTADYFSLEYVCQEHTNCTNHELDGCRPQVNEVCAYCCEDVVTCKIQRDDLFNYVFPTAGPPQTTPRPVTTTSLPAGGNVFYCPKCDNSYDYKSCLGAQSCSMDLFDVCKLDVDVRDRNRLEYSCHKFVDCPSYDIYSCNTTVNAVCSYCCYDPVSCQNQREDLFNFVFPPIPGTLAPMESEDEYN